MAGRKGYQSEIKTREIIDKSLPIISMALSRRGVYKKLPIETVVELAKCFVLKAIPDLSRDDSNRATIYIVSSDSERLPKNLLEVLPSQLTENNSQK